MASLPLGLGVIAYGTVFGVLARGAGLSVPEVLLMSGLVFAGSAQFVALGLWSAPPPVLALVLTTLVVNLRHVLMGAALVRWLQPGSVAGPRGLVYAALFLLNDESWALTLQQAARAGGRGLLGFLVGSGLVLYAAWVGSTVAGARLGAVFDDPARWRLDFAFTAVFVALLAGLWRGRGDLVPWLVAAAVAIAAAAWLPGKWYILLGGLAGSLAGAARHGR